MTPRGLYRTFRRRARHIKALAHPVTAEAIGACLAPWAPHDIVMVHSSLSACGHVYGGAAAVIEALEAWTAGGTLAMPAHSYCYADGRGDAPVFDPATTGSVVGAVTDAFWRRPGVVRSRHPTHSLAAKGPGAVPLTEGHDLSDTPCGAATPYARLVQWDASVLMFGVTLDSYTLFHTAEDAANVAYLYYPELNRLNVVGHDGTVHAMTMRRQDMNVRRRFKDMDVWLERQGLLQRCVLGRGELLFIESSWAVHRALLDVLARKPDFLTAAHAARSTMV